MIMQHVYIHQSKNNHAYAKYCVRFDVPSVINSFPKNILDKIDTHSLQGFTRYIRDYILQTYQEICSCKLLYLWCTCIATGGNHDNLAINHLFVFYICHLYLSFIFIKIQIDLRMMYE